MFKNVFANLQKVGKSLMLPVFVLPVAGISLGIGSANFSWLPEIVSCLMMEAGGSVFANIPLLFAIGIALGFTNNDGVSALAAVVAHGIMIKTIAIITPIALNLSAKEVALQHLADTGVLGGITSGAIAAYMFNRFYRIDLPEYLGFFAGKRSVPIVSGLAAIFVGVIFSFIWPPISSVIQTFSQWAAYQNPTLAFGIYGFVERCLVLFGLHHIWNVPFQMQIGEFINSAGQIFHGDIPRYIAGDPAAGKLSGGFLFKMYGLPAAAIAIWHAANPENRMKTISIMSSAALTSFLTGITEPVEFSFMFVAPILYIIHAILAGLAFPICILLDMRNGISFSHGLIDFILLSGNGNKLWLFPIVGIGYAIVYYLIFRILIEIFNLQTPGRTDRSINNNETVIKKNDNINDHKEFKKLVVNDEIVPSLVEALGGKNNIVNLDACITRLRIKVINITKVNKQALKELSARRSRCWFRYTSNFWY